MIFLASHISYIHVYTGQFPSDPIPLNPNEDNHDIDEKCIDEGIQWVLTG